MILNSVKKCELFFFINLAITYQQLHIQDVCSSYLIFRVKFKVLWKCNGTYPELGHLK